LNASKTQFSRPHKKAPFRAGLKINNQTVAVMDMPSGRVKFFNTDRGFGFIVPVVGQVLVYNTAPARDGRLKAVNLRLL
jgi:hypothetical protein